MSKRRSGSGRCTPPKSLRCALCHDPVDAGAVVLFAYPRIPDGSLAHRECGRRLAYMLGGVEPIERLESLPDILRKIGGDRS